MSSEDINGILNIDSSLYKTRLSKKYLNRKPYIPVDPKKVISYIPGTVVEILVSQGSHVKKGDELIILDAMKMKNRIKSEIDGKISSITVKIGTKVSKGTTLIELE
ncbi:MAG TPA: acetyl-CoA carboxylase biotin carboxyl carrier protein subunit [Bacteroidales bacterium]|nr:acetyl-CoA carboxylase biotin carboxyl carrier protein subunit [Bacteroidales bacterium]